MAEGGVGKDQKKSGPALGGAELDPVICAELPINQRVSVKLSRKRIRGLDGNRSFLIFLPSTAENSVHVVGGKFPGNVWAEIVWSFASNA